MFDFILEYFRLATSGFWSFVAVFALTVVILSWLNDVIRKVLSHRARRNKQTMEIFPPKKDV